MRWVQSAGRSGRDHRVRLSALRRMLAVQRKRHRTGEPDGQDGPIRSGFHLILAILVILFGPFGVVPQATAKSGGNKIARIARMTHANAIRSDLNCPLGARPCCSLLRWRWIAFRHERHFNSLA